MLSRVCRVAPGVVAGAVGTFMKAVSRGVLAVYTTTTKKSKEKRRESEKMSNAMRKREKQMTWALTACLCGGTAGHEKSLGIATHAHEAVVDSSSALQVAWCEQPQRERAGAAAARWSQERKQRRSNLATEACP